MTGYTKIESNSEREIEKNLPKPRACKEIQAATMKSVK